MVPAAADGAECRRPRGAERALRAVEPRAGARAGALRQGRDRPRAGRGPQARAAHRDRTQGQVPAMMLRGHGEDGARPAVVAPRGPEADAVAALVKLGYSQGQAAEMVARAANDLGQAAPVDALIRESLRATGR